MLKNTEKSYGSIAKLFHWLMALMIIALVTVGFIMSGMEDSPDKYRFYGIHKATGVIVLILALLRISWKFLNKEVSPVKNLPKIIALGAKLGHLALYFFMFLMPISGILMSLFAGYDVHVFNLFTITSWQKDLQMSGIFHIIHTTSGLVLAITISIHVLAALYHHIIRKDETLKRMV